MITLGLGLGNLVTLNLNRTEAGVNGLLAVLKKNPSLGSVYITNYNAIGCLMDLQDLLKLDIGSRQFTEIT